MKTYFKRLIVLGGVCFSALSLANEQGFIPGEHGPAGIMAGHLHAKDEVMTGYRYVRSSLSGLYFGSDEVPNDALLSAGYGMTPIDMTTDMIMLDVMYGVTDKLTIMVMPRYMDMNMTMQGTAASSSSAPVENGISGFGDTQVSALYELAGGNHYQVIGTLGMSVPTGKVDKKNPDGTFVHYGMQLGSGTWDFTPMLTYTGYTQHVSWGGQLSLTRHLQNSNDSGYALGDSYKVQAWGAAHITPWMSFSVRVAYEDQDAISGQYKETFRSASPLDRPGNYGGEFLDVAVGINTVFTTGNAAGLRLGLEWVSRVQEDYNGYQLGMDDGLVASISYAFK